MKRLSRWWSALGILIILASLLPAAPAASAPPAPPDPLAQLTLATGAAVQVGYHPATGQVNYLTTAAGHPWRAAGLEAQADASLRAESAARQFLNQYGSLFGLGASDSLTAMRNVRRDTGRTYLRFQQEYQGVPVFGAELIVQLDAAQAVEAVIGEALPNLALSVTPAVTANAAVQTALAETARVHGVDAATLQAGAASLWIYQPSLTEPQGGFTRLVWRVEVTPLALGPIRELVLVDAQRGSVALQFNQTDTALSRNTYTAGNSTSLPGTLQCNTADTTCAGAGSDTHAVAAHKYAGDTYNFYSSRFGRDSINGAGMTLISTVHFDSGYLNAFWNGSQMVYGDAAGFPLGDDVVAHELTHGVTQYESNLFYYYQSGAINEALSDVFGELMDLTNGAGTDTAGVRWQMGEDVTGLGAIRDMEDPPVFSDPDKVTSIYYKSNSGDVTNPAFDNGGVHTNSGVLNKAAYLLVDGGSFNGYTVSSLGITKVARIAYYAATNLLTSGSDYLDLYNALYSACNTLIGTDGIAAPDCTEVRDATDATEMNLQPVPNFNPEAPLCPGAESVVTTLFSDSLEVNSANWTFSALTGSNRWSRSTGYAHTGTYALLADDNPAATTDSVAAMNTSYLLPTGAYLHFAHAFGFNSAGPDGGIVEYSIDGGAHWTNAGGYMFANGYNGVINAGPLAGNAGFIGDSHGYMSTRLLLAPLAGQSVRFRFRMSNNSSGLDVGWAVDDVQLYTCTNANPPFSSISLPLALRSYGGTPSSWTDIMTEGFEGSWPGANWIVTDPGYEEYYWAKRSCRAATGSNSAWAMGGGSIGNGLGCGANYINGAFSWMIYGPFSLADASQGEFSLQLWLNSQAGADGACLMASTNGNNFYGDCYSGSTGGSFAARTLDLADVYTLGNLTGQGSVWVAVLFDSDSSTTAAEGAHVDDLLLRKCAGGCASAAALLTGPADGLTRTPAAFTLTAATTATQR